MSTGTRPRTGTTPARGSLLRAELHRFTSRRFIRALLLLSLVGLLVGTAIAFSQHRKTSPEVLAAAQQRLEEQVEADRGFHEQCLRDAPDDLSPEEVREQFCGPEPDASTYEIGWFLDQPPFSLAENLPGGAIGVGVLSAALLFLIGATYIGAEWSSRSIVALLFWEPRRLKVVATKLAVTLVAAVLIAAVLQLLWVGAAYFLASTRGTTGPLPPTFWQDLLQQEGRLLLLVLVGAGLGFGVANLARNTGAALGAAFFYVLVVENAVRVLRPTWQQYLLTDNALALVQDGGHRIYLFDEQTQADSEIVVSNLRGGLTLALACLVVLALGAWLFRRRDLQ